MTNPIRLAIVSVAVACAAVAATPPARELLTPRRIHDLTQPRSGAVNPKSYKVEISGIGSATLPADKPEGKIESIRELIYPTKFDPPQTAANGAPIVTPTSPTAFETVNTGWTVRLSAKPHGKLIAVSAVADHVEGEMVPGGYGAIAGPVYNDQGEVLTPNKVDQPRLQTTSTRFHIFALPGEPYEVTLFRGAKTEKHIVTVTTK